MKPTFLGIGCQKCGTTWFYNCLIQHPEIYMSNETKEIHYYDNHYVRGLSWYLSHFHDAHYNQSIGEFTPNYIYKREYIERIYKDFPDIKLLIVLRNPIERAVSHYNHYLRINQSNDSFFEAINNDELIIKAGRYDELIDEVYKYFNEQQVLVLFYEDIKAQPVTLLSSVYNFLGVSDSFIPDKLYEASNIAMTPRSNTLFRPVYYIKNKLRDHGLHGFVNILKPVLKPILLKKQSRKIDKSINEFLVDYYSDSIKRLTKMGFEIKWLM